MTDALVVLIHAIATRARAAVGAVLSVVAAIGRLVRSAAAPSSAGWLMRRVALQQLRFTAVQAIPLVAAVAACLGATVTLEAHARAAQLGLSETVARTLGVLVVRDAGPLLAAVIVTARSGTAIAAEIATCRLLGETDALAGMGVDLVQFYVIPRIIGVAVATALLTVYFVAITLGVAVAMASLRHIATTAAYTDTLRGVLRPDDLFWSAVRGGAFGAGVAWLSSAVGLRARGGQADVPRAVTHAAVRSIMLLAITSAVFAAIWS
ncbi:MAG TPA: ABC transporter permease [Gemmatimonadaceae bacterium]|nr:ABC transporter permease [Gemmatimonadaceae bacterium]HTD60779.1 ABC transporter permease [Gemmatimonadaceae bacterium]